MRNNATETENTKKRKKLKHNLLIPHTTQCLNELGKSCSLYGTCVRVHPMCWTVRRGARACCAWALRRSQKRVSPSSAFKPESLFCFRFTLVSNMAEARRALINSDRNQDGMKAEDEVVCFCDSRGCFMVLNVADRTGPEPSPGTRTSLQVTSRVDSTVKMMLHKQLTKHILPAFEVQYFVQFCFVDLLFLFVLIQCFGHNQGCKYKTKILKDYITVC